MKRIIALIPVLFLSYCEGKPAPSKPEKIVRVWDSSGTTYAETDSLAACRVGDQVRLFATSKHGHRLDVFDAANGKFIKSIGREGNGAGEFRRPNGIAVGYLKDDEKRPVLFVIERDNARVQVIRADNYASVGIFGEGILTRPYGAAVASTRDGLTLFVSDDRVKDHRCIRRFSVSEQSGQVRGTYVNSIGETSGTGAILKPESIVWDAKRNVLLACDEDKHQKNVKVYAADGRFTGTVFGGGIVEGDPEGLVVVETDQGGFIILTDQRKDITIWHLFDRSSYRYLASVTSDPKIANTDGICLFPKPFGKFNIGGLFAVNNDADVCGFELGDFVRVGNAAAKE